jgi:DNA-binding FadR family transcriptional regulator
MSPTLTEKVANRLRRSIASGQWSPGATLPAERRLAADLGVSRGSLRGGIAQLQAEGLLEARQGSGTKVRQDLAHAPMDWLSWILANEELGSDQTYEFIAQLVGLRRVVALHLLQQAVARMQPEDLLHLQSLIADQALLIADPPAYREADIAIESFFLELAANRVVPPLNRSLRRCFNSRPELVEAFFGPLELHAQGNQVLLLLVSESLQNPDKTEALMHSLNEGLKSFEEQGLKRVKTCLENS